MKFFLSNAGYIALAWLFVLLVLEQCKKRFSVPSSLRDGGYARWLKNAAFIVINRFLGPVVMLPIFFWATQVHLWTRPRWMSGVVEIVIAVIVLDLVNYWFHRLAHTIPLLWRFHEIHHLDSALDATTGLRVHFAEMILQGLFKAAAIVLFALPLKAVLFFEAILLLEALFHHSNICIPKKLEKLLSYVIITPNTHSVHHHALLEDTDSNYGFIFVIWDKVFKSFNQAERKSTWYMGLEYAPDLSLFELLVSPFTWVKLKYRMQKKGYQVVENVS